MNSQHLSTVIWVRWRIRVNQIRKAGAFNAVISVIAFVLFVMLSAIAFFAAIPVTTKYLGTVEPLTLLLVWDLIVLAFTFSWTIGVVTDLQRSEALSVDKFLHLPVSPSGVFTVNYLSSWATLSAAAFAPAVTGVMIGLVYSRGLGLLWSFLLTAAYFFMITAVTYQFRGWLAALMSNPRRRRTIIVVITMSFVALGQFPNLINLWSPWTSKETTKNLADKIVSKANEQKLATKRQTNEISQEEFDRQTTKLREDKKRAESETSAQEAEQWVRIANLVCPLGWLPYGVIAGDAGQHWAPPLAIAGMALIGAGSLRRAYRTTLRYYTGAFNATGTKKAKPITRGNSDEDAKPRAAVDARFMERRIKYVSEHVAAIALCSLRSLWRAPEAKMMMLTPFIMILVFGSLAFRHGSEVPVAVASLMAIGGITMTLFGTAQFIGNQFGFDRSGFRVFVLCPAERRDILFGKNIAMGVIALSMCWALLAVMQVVRPMHWDHFLAMAPQSIAMFLIFGLMANWLSILAPMPVAAGSMRPTQPSISVILIHLLFTLLIPFALAPTVLPWALEWIVHYFNPETRWPIFLPLAVIQLLVVGVVYRVLLNSQGNLLAQKEIRILGVVAKRAE